MIDTNALTIRPCPYLDRFAELAEAEGNSWSYLAVTFAEGPDKWREPDEEAHKQLQSDWTPLDQSSQKAQNWLKLHRTGSR